jgi:hypothetical protein
MEEQRTLSSTDGRQRTLFNYRHRRIRPTPNLCNQVALVALGAALGWIWGKVSS